LKKKINIHYLTPCGRFLLEKLISAQLVKIPSGFMEPVTEFTKARH